MLKVCAQAQGVITFLRVLEAPYLVLSIRSVLSQNMWTWPYRLYHLHYVVTDPISGANRFKDLGI